MTTRGETRPVKVGAVTIGGGAPVSVQTMAKADPHDLAALQAEVSAAAAAGADLVRLAVVDAESAAVFGEVRRTAGVPLVADIQFDHRLALAALEQGADALRLNPGNLASGAAVRAVARAAQARGVPIRVGANLGSLARGRGRTAAELVDSALEQAAILEAEGFGDYLFSVKASDAAVTAAAARRLAERTNRPLHLGLTEAGTELTGAVRSAAVLAPLLNAGLGDTLRISLCAPVASEVAAARELLAACQLLAIPQVVVCPTCGRTRSPLKVVAERIEERLRAVRARAVKVAVMGCAVNGPGEAADAEVALCGGEGDFVMYVRGVAVGRVTEAEAAERVVEHVLSQG